MEDLEDSEIQFSEWTESGEFEMMDTEDGVVEQRPNDQSFPAAIADKLEERIEDSPRNLKTAVFCFPFECDGKMFFLKDEREQATLNSYLGQGVLDGLIHPEEMPTKSFREPVIKLFGSKFVACSALFCQTDSMFYLLRQQIFKLESMQSEEGILPLSHEANMKCTDIRKECATFMAYLHYFINNCLMTSWTTLHFADNQFIQSLLRISTIIRKQLEALVLFLGRLTELPLASVIRADNPGIFSSSRPSAVSHLFHLYLDLIWNTLQALWEILLKQDKETRSHSSEVDNIVDSVKRIVMPLLWDLTSLAAISYNKVNRADSHRASPYPCSCVCELWVLLIQTMDHLSSNFDIEPFWSSLSCILHEVMNPEDTSTSMQNDTQDSPATYAPLNFNCKDPVGFSWWLVSHVAPLYWYNEKGVFSAKKKGSVPGNWVFVFDLLKTSLSALKDGHEEAQRRFYLKCCITVSINWSAHTGLILWLWDYFHKKMNDLFNIPSSSLHGMATVSLSSSQLTEQCFDRCRGVQTSMDQENSFSLLLRLIAIHLNKLLSTGSLQGWKQMKGRFYSKFHKRRMEELNETGVRHFLSLFLTLSCVAELEDVANKMCSFLDLLDFSSEQPNKKLVILKGLFSLMLVYKERKTDFGYLACKVADIFSTVVKEYTENSSSNRDKGHQRHSWDLVALYLDGTQEVFEHKNKQDLSETKLLESEGFNYLFTSCRENELRHLLAFVQSILDAIRPHNPDRMSIEESRPDIVSCLWTHLFPHLQKLIRDRSVVTSLPIILADTMAGFALLTLDRHPERAGAPGASLSSLIREYGTEDELPASFSCRFLCHVIPAPGVPDLLEAESLQTHVIHTWFRCLLQLSPSNDNCAALTRAIAKVPEMEWLTRNQAGLASSSNSENTLKLFIMSVGSYNTTLTKFDEVIQFRERCQIYFGDVAKYIDSFISTGGPQVSLRLAYSVSGLLFKHCYKIIYSKTQPHCLLPRLLDQLIVPLHSNKKAMLPVVLQCVKAYLHWFLQGLSYLDFRRDDFIKRKIRQIFGKYFHPLCQKSQAAASQPGNVAVKNPFLVVLKGSLMEEPTHDASDFRQFTVEIIADSFLQLPQPPQNLTSTLFFLVQLFKRTQSSRETARNTLCLLAPVLGCLLACNARSPANEPPNIRRQATDLLTLMIESCKDPVEPNYRNTLLPNMRNFVFNNLQQFQGLVFKTFEPLTILDPDIVADLIPAFKQSITQSEQKRGVGSDSQLRSALRNLLQRIGKAHEVELH